jgi:hypothetical protein
MLPTSPVGEQLPKFGASPSAYTSPDRAMVASSAAMKVLLKIIVSPPVEIVSVWFRGSFQGVRIKKLAKINPPIHFTFFFI